MEKLCIVVLQRGYVYVGYRSVSPDGSIHLRAARDIIYWGTSRHLGQLKTGPTPQTRLGDSADIDYHPLTEVLSQPVTGDWGI